MKRSEINKIIRDMELLAGQYGFSLPPFCHWTPEEWACKGPEYQEIRDNKLGWDITDFGRGDFQRLGFSLITLRNGNLGNPAYQKTYAEKLLMLYQGQNAAMHYHWNKMEDIVNRGGNSVFLTLYNGDENGCFLESEVTVMMDGKRITVPPGSRVKLSPGESITITPYLYHDFHVESAGGPVLLGEISSCNDDVNDNCFYEPAGRFPDITEDEAPYRLLCTEYPCGGR